MRKAFLLPALLLLPLLSFSRESANLLRNSGFEDPTPAPWEGDRPVLVEQAHTGARAVRITMDRGFKDTEGQFRGALHQTIAAPAAGDYVFSGKYQADTSEMIALYLVLDASPDSRATLRNYLPVSRFGKPDPRGWRTFTMPVRLPPGVEKLHVVIECIGRRPGLPLLFDQVTLVRQED